MYPFTIAVVNSKGGVTKTTTSVCLADLFGEQAGKTLLIDLDRQASAVAWSSEVETRGQAIHADVIQIDTDLRPAAVVSRISEVSQGYEFLILDTATGDEDRADAAVEAVKAHGGIVLIPTGTTDLDLPRAVVTLQEVDGRAPTFVLLSKTRTGTIALRDARTQLSELGATVLDAEIPIRESIANAASRGIIEALVLYKPVAEEILDKINE